MSLNSLALWVLVTLSAVAVGYALYLSYERWQHDQEKAHRRQARQNTLTGLAEVSRFRQQAQRIVEDGKRRMDEAVKK